MDPDTFKRVDEAVDSIADELDSPFESLAFAEVRNSLHRLSNAAGKAFSVSLECVVRVSDAEGERSLPLLNTGLSAYVDSQPFRTWGDSTPQRYIVDGEIRVVPHDRCPRCWELWDFKFDHRSCEHCDAGLGKDVKVLLDSDVCPRCERGQVTAASPRCSECGFQVDSTIVNWG
jgi:hypothetical protein